MPVLNLVHLNIHVADMDRSIAFYRLLGWREMFPGGSMGKAHDAGPLVKISPTNEHAGGVIRTVILTLGDDPRAATKLELMQYVDPPTSPRPYQPANQAGVHRIAMRVKGIDDMVDNLRAAGVEIGYGPNDLQIGELSSRQRYVLFEDPDKNLVELIELFR